MRKKHVRNGRTDKRWRGLCSEKIMTGPTPDTGEGLPSQDWEFLLKATTLYASNHINRWFWRGSLGGVLPDGFDPQSIAAEAISDFLHFPLGITVRRPLTAVDIQRDLEQRVRRHINRLYHRSENRILRNEPDLALVTLDDGEAVSIIELIPDPNPRPDKALIAKESAIHFDQSNRLFSASLGKDKRLGKVFDLFCDGRSKLADQSSLLKLSPGMVRNLRRRFLRKWGHFHGQKFSAENIKT